MNKKIIIFALSLLVISFTSCDIEKFAELNTNPTAIGTPNVAFLFTNILLEGNSQAYDEWFYDYDKYYHVWSQIWAGNQGTFTRTMESFTVMTRVDARTDGYISVLRQAREVVDLIDNRLSDSDRDAAQCIRAAVFPLLIHKALKVTDAYGSMPYSQAGRARYTDPMLLRPEFDTQEELFELWDQELKDAFAVLSDPPAGQLTLGTNDWLYNSDWERWAKLANTMRLRIAARWYRQNPTRAKAIVEEVYNSGLYMDAVADDYVHFGGRTNDNLGNQIRWQGFGNKELIDFLRENKDPRLFWLFEKNRYSTSVIRRFLTEDKPLPAVMLPYITNIRDNDPDDDSAPRFTKDFDWTADGEPWGRYHGIPNTLEDYLSATVQTEWLGSAQFRLTATDQITFLPWSFANTHFFQPRITTVTGYSPQNYPDITMNAAGTTGTLPVSITTQSNYHYRGRFVTAAEANYILAEFKVLGANIATDANELFQRAIELSLRSHDLTAQDHNPMFYRTSGADDRSVLTVLQEKWIEDLLEQPAYNLTGNQLEDLEKIYVNMLIHYAQTPNEIFVTARRGGVPKSGSAIGWAYSPFSPDPNFRVPRRLNIERPTEDNLNYANIVKATEDQGFGFNLSSYPALLWEQRIWYDKTAPDWGEGPKP